jgi:anti-sigma-K factor RskA
MSNFAEHEQLGELAGLYVLGGLAATERRAFEEHMATCEVCAEEVRALGAVAQALPYAVTQVDPPAALRARVLAVTGAASSARSHVVPMPPRQPPRPSRAPLAWLSAAAMLLVSVGLGGYAWMLRGDLQALRRELRDTQARLERSEQQVTVATRAVSVAEARMAVLTAPDLRQVDLEGQPVAPSASGRAFLSRSRGLLFTASSLPPLPAGRSYQLWVVTAQAPVSAGLLELDASGRVAQAFETPADMAPAVAIAVTIEPEGGVPAPTGDKYLVGLTE